ncbi:hypothetical protein [Bacillus sp. FJAT-27445]|uniref:hypothetical protein n=1 Tax=Bacillus sp. FJAT-27445 TaxID=1679166 RepID=UPI0007435D7F|nr:hypothetical protein [Bacillus sp. FJAT-27445]
MSWADNLHYFQVPFYTIEYGIAMLGALQLLENYPSLTSPFTAYQIYFSPNVFDEIQWLSVFIFQVVICIYFQT